MTILRVIAGAILIALLTPVAMYAQIIQRNAQFWLPASYNHQFYKTYPDAARSFYAAHYAHFGVYEVGLTAGAQVDERMAQLEQRIRALVVNPPRLEPPIDVIAPNWKKMAYTTAAAMDWTHHLHEQLYDILTDDRVEDKKAAGERAISHYLTNLRSAFSTRGYGHAFMMAGGSWAETFAHRYPKINGILWAYHWHHASVYEALMEEDAEQRSVELDRVIRVFADSVLQDPPKYMPLTAQMAPQFSAMFPAAAQIFDNLHMMHDVVNDIMVDDRMGPEAKSLEIDRMLAQMLYVNQEWVIPPTIPAGQHGDMPMTVMTVPTQLPDGSWLPQGHPDAKMPEMDHSTMGHEQARRQ